MGVQCGLHGTMLIIEENYFYTWQPSWWGTKHRSLEVEAWHFARPRSSPELAALAAPSQWNLHDSLRPVVSTFRLQAGATM